MVLVELLISSLYLWYVGVRMGRRGEEYMGEDLWTGRSFALAWDIGLYANYKNHLRAVGGLYDIP